MTDDDLVKLLRESGDYDPAFDVDVGHVKVRASERRRARRKATMLGLVGIAAVGAPLSIYFLNSGSDSGGLQPDLSGELGPGCIPPASVAPLGADGSDGDRSVLATASAGSKVAVSGVVQIRQPGKVIDAEIIIGTTDSTPGVGPGSELPQTAALRGKNQVAVAVAESPVDGTGLTATATTLDVGSYPVYYVVNYAETAACGGSTSAQVMGQIGIVEVHN